MEQVPNIGDPAIQHVAVKMPQFSQTNVNLFFKRSEAQFHISKITSETTRYYYVISALPDDIGEIVLTEASQHNPYQQLKNELKSLCEKTKQSKLNDAFSTLSLCDDKPSVIARRVNKILSDAGITPNDDIVIHKILQALRPQLRDLLLAHSSDSLERFQHLADTVWAAHHTKEIASISTPRARSPSPRWPTTASIPRGLQPFHEGQTPRICRAHLYYGADAKTCLPFCEFPSQKQNPSHRDSSRRQPRSTSPTPEN